MTILSRLYMFVVLVILSAPIVVVAGVSLNERKSLYFPPRGVSVAWYEQLFTDPSWRGALINSLTIAVFSAIFAVMVALPLAYAIWRYRLRFGALLYTIGLSPFILPPVVSAIGFLSFWATVGLYGQMIAVIFSHGIFLTTLPLVTITLGLRSIDPTVIEAAETMGANERAVARTIVLPLIAPYMLSGLAFAFVLSLNEYIIAFMIAGFTVETLPIKIFNSLRYGYTPTMASAAVVFVALAVIVFGLMKRPVRRPAQAAGSLGAAELDHDRLRRNHLSR